MVAYKDNPGHDKEYLYQEGNYRLPSTTGTQDISADNSSLDKLVRSTPSNELYQKRIEPLRSLGDYDLSQPVWFDEIMKRLAANEAAVKGKDRTSTSRPSQDYLNN
jgi:hypothetical protein